MSYFFNTEKDEIEYVIEEDLIHVAIARAHLVNPDPSIEPEWTAAIYRDLAQHDPRFSWFNFLTQVLP